MARNTIHKSATGRPKAAPSRRPKAAGAKREASRQNPSTPASKRKPPKQKPSKQVPSKQKPWTKAEIEEAFRRLREANPEPRGELEHINPYTLLVAVVLSAQATDAGVNKATRALFAQVDTPEKMVALGEAKLRDAIKTIGLFNTKAKNVIALSHKLIAEHGGVVPRERAVLETLPGVGRKTANVVLNVAFGEETFAVDTHVFRVGNRTGMAPGKTPLEVESKLEALVPPAYRRHAHHWLILHGRYICKAQRPRCEKCPINDLCRWPEKTTFMANG
jgi:endonuclease-3